MAMNPVVHFEMSASDQKRMVEFYTIVFGWKAQQMGPEMGNYVVVQTGETDEKGMPQKPGMINGGFYQRTADQSIQYPSIVVSVENLQEAIRKIRAAGGKVEMEPMDIPGIGLFVSAFDTEGNRISVLQPLAMQGDGK